MRGNRPKSNARGQTRVCLAAAAALVAMGGVPSAFAASPAGNSVKEDRINELTALAEKAKNDLDKKVVAEADDRFVADAGHSLHTPLKDITDIKDVDKLKSALNKSATEIQGEIDKIKAGIPPTGITPSQQFRLDALNALKKDVESLEALANPIDRASQERQALEKRLEGAIKEWIASLQALNEAQRLDESVHYKKARWEQAAEGAEAERLAKTRELAPRVASDDPAKPVTWNDQHLIDFMSDTDRPAAGETLITKDTTLEISQRSGLVSDAIEGANNRERDVGLIRAMDGANHTVLVNKGTLGAHEGIDGPGRLDVEVGSDGVLKFVSGPGIDNASKHISLVAGVSQGAQPGEAGGVIEFDAGTGAGGATIDIKDKGQLRFLKDTHAGSSYIMIEQGGQGLFDKGSGAENATIRNSGHLEFIGAKGGDAHLDNTSKVALSMEDTQLERMSIVNSGMLDLSGKTTADAASIELNGGYLNLAEIKAESAKDGEKAGADAPTLTIGSLSGNGHVGTGETQLKLGALGRDEAFAGEIGKDVLGSHGAHVTKVGTGHLTFSGDQSGIETLNVENGTLLAAHRNALGTGLLTISEPGTIALANDVYDVKKFENAGTLKLHGYRLVIDSYESKGDKARIESDAKKDADGIHRGTLEVNKDGDFTKTKVVLRPIDNSVSPRELLEKKIQVIVPGPNAKVKLGEVEYGSIPTNPDDGGDDGSVIIDPNKGIAFLDPNAPYSGNEQSVLASLQGVTLDDIVSGRVGGSVLGQLVLLPAGSAEQRRAARMLSGESLANNAAAAYSAADTFRSSMQTRMLAGGSLPDCNTTNGQRAGENGTAVWGSFKGTGARQESDDMSFSTKGIDGAFGVDRRLNRNALVGAAFGIGTRSSVASDLPGSSDVRSASVGLYGSYLSDTRWFANGGVFYTNHNVSTERTVAARDVSARVSGKTGGRTLGLFGEVGQRVLAGGVNVDPFLGVRIANTRLNGYDETDRDAGQGNNGLHVGPQTSNSRRVIAGVRLWRELVNTAGGSVIPSLRLAYEHEFGDTQGSLTNAIFGAPRSFTVSGVKLGRDIFTADLGADIRVTRQLNVHVGGDLSLRAGEKAVAGGVSAKYRF
ncbi:hypothetical protein DBA20_10820 [Pandoraea capi]|nr:hypothetical protein [Pandoraea sp. LA3]MDN4583476.1 hypothetical protein [Pandoraea capi]